MRAGRLTPDGKILTKEGQVYVTKVSGERERGAQAGSGRCTSQAWGRSRAWVKGGVWIGGLDARGLSNPSHPPSWTLQAAIEPVWYLPAVAERFGV